MGSDLKDRKSVTLDGLRARLRSLAKKAGSALLVLALCLGAIELSARLARVWLRTEPPADTRGRRVILAVGDSFTFGMGVAYRPGVYNETAGRRPASYPELLQALLDQTAPGRYRVVVAARPGRNSSQVSRELPELLARYQPVAVLVLAGTNNTTNYEDSYYLQVAAGLPSHAPEDRLVAWSHHLLGVRLLYNLARAARHRFYPLPEGTLALPDARRLESEEGAIHERLLEHDLGDVIATSRAHGAVPFVATYPEGLPPNPKIREIAAERAVRLVDLEKIFAPQLAAHGRPWLMSVFDTFHCSSRGYVEMALAFHAELARASAPWSPPPASPEQSAWLSEHRSRIMQEEAARSDAGIDLECAARLECASGWFDARKDTLDAASTLQELAPPEVWAELAASRLDRLVAIEDRNPGRTHMLVTMLAHGHRRMAYELAREEAARHPGDPVWPPLVEATRPPAEEEPSALPARLSVTDPAVHREGSAAMIDGGLEYAIGGRMLWVIVHAAAAGHYRVSASVSGSPCPADVWPELACVVDGRTVFEAAAGPTRALVTGPPLVLSAGLHRVELSFTNDFYDPPRCDRNLRIYGLEVEPSSH